MVVFSAFPVIFVSNICELTLTVIPSNVNKRMLGRVEVLSL